MEELQKQLQRCYAWLEEEPNDEEVKIKVKELEETISRMKKNNEKSKLLKKINEKEKLIKDLKKHIVHSVPILKGMEEECYAMAGIAQDMNNTYIEKINSEIEEYNKLVIEYRKV